MMRQLRYALMFLALFTLVCGILYPIAVTGISQTVFRRQANGSLIFRDGQATGSQFIGQQFSDPGYFWGRLSATDSFPYNAAASSGSNYGTANPALREAVKTRIDALLAADPDNDRPIPVDLVTSSASGLDPDISLAAAEYQVGRVARHRGLSEGQVDSLVRRFTKGRQFGFLGEPRVNVLKLNLALDGLR